MNILLRLFNVWALRCFEHSNPPPACALPGFIVQVCHYGFYIFGRHGLAFCLGFGLLFLGFLFFKGESGFYQCFEFWGLLELVDALEFGDKFIPKSGGSVLFALVVVGAGVSQKLPRCATFGVAYLGLGQGHFFRRAPFCDVFARCRGPSHVKGTLLCGFCFAV